MDMTYATVPVFGQNRKLYREVKMAYMVSNKDKSINHPIYAFDTEIGSSIFYTDGPVKTEEDLTLTDQEEQEADSKCWQLFFGGSYSKGKAGAGIHIISPSFKKWKYAYSLDFDSTNNVAEYEALIHGLLLLKDKKARNVKNFGDSELVINQVKGIYQTRHPRLRSYRNEVLDLLGNFFWEYSIEVIPRTENRTADALATVASGYQPFPQTTDRIYKRVKRRPSIPDNIRHWQVFEDD